MAGGVATILGGVGWLHDKKTPTEYGGVNELGDSQRLRHRWSYLIGRLALGVSVATVLLGLAFRSSAAGTAVTVGLGGMIAVIAVWSLLASEPTHDFLTLAIVGFALLLSPWAAGFTGGRAPRGRHGWRVDLPRRLASQATCETSAWTSRWLSAMIRPRNTGSNFPDAAGPDAVVTVSVRNGRRTSEFRARNRNTLRQSWCAILGLNQ